MIPDKTFLRLYAQKHNLAFPRELENRLLVHFEDEPYEDFNTASILEDMVCLYCQSHARLDVAIPDPLTRLKERCDGLKDLITDLWVNIAYLQDLCDKYERILENTACSERSEYAFHTVIGR